MKQFAKIMLMALSLGILASGLSSIPSRPAAASVAAAVQVVNPTTSPIPMLDQPGALTNVGRLGSELVTIVPDFQCLSPGSGWAQVFPDGSSQCFNSIPAGKALVITDFEWVAEGFASKPGDVFSLAVTIAAVNPALGSPGPLVSSGTVGTNGIAGGSEHATTGLITTSAIPQVVCVGNCPGGGFQFQAVTLRGYLVANQ